MLIRLKKVLVDDFSHETPEDFYTSQWQREKKCFWFVLYRWIIAFFFAFSVGFTIFENIERGYFRVFFIYLTHLNLVGTMLATSIGAITATLYFYDKIDVKLKTLPFVVKLYWFLWNQSIVFSCLVSMFYWGLLYRTDESNLDLNNVLVHMTNSMVLIVDLMIVKHPTKYSNFIYVVGTELIYLLFTVIYQLAGGLNKKGENFVYSPSDWINKPMVGLSCALVFLVLSIALHLAINLIHTIRNTIHRKIQTVDTKSDEEDPSAITLV